MRKLRSKIFLEMLEARGLSVNAFAMQSGIPQGTLSHLVSGDRNMGPKVLSKLCDALRCAPSDISEWQYEAKDIPELERDREEIVGLFGQLTAPQRSRILRLAQSLVDANRTECEIERVRDFGEDAQ